MISPVKGQCDIRCRFFGEMERPGTRAPRGVGRRLLPCCCHWCVWSWVALVCGARSGLVAGGWLVGLVVIGVFGWWLVAVIGVFGIPSSTTTLVSPLSTPSIPHSHPRPCLPSLPPRTTTPRTSHPVSPAYPTPALPFPVIRRRRLGASWIIITRIEVSD